MIITKKETDYVLRLDSVIDVNGWNWEENNYNDTINETYVEENSQWEIYDWINHLKSHIERYNTKK